MRLVRRGINGTVRTESADQSESTYWMLQAPAVPGEYYRGVQVPHPDSSTGWVWLAFTIAFRPRGSR